MSSHFRGGDRVLTPRGSGTVIKTVMNDWILVDLDDAATGGQFMCANEDATPLGDSMNERHAPLVADIRNYLETYHLTLSLEARRLLERSLGSLTEELDPAPTSDPTLPAEEKVRIGTAVRVKHVRLDNYTDATEGLVAAYRVHRIFRWYVSLGDWGGWFASSELELI